MTIVDKAIEQLSNNTCIGLGSGRAARAFVQALGARLRENRLRVQGVATSTETEEAAQQAGVPLITLEKAGPLDLTVDGADEVDPHLNLIKGYGHALVREKIVAAYSKRLLILVGQEKLVPQLGTRKRLPLEVMPFALPLCLQRLEECKLPAVPYQRAGRLVLTDNGNYIVDLIIDPLDSPLRLEEELRAIPGVVGTGLFLNMADSVYIGTNDTLELVEERHRSALVITGANR